RPSAYPSPHAPSVIRDAQRRNNESERGRRHSVYALRIGDIARTPQRELLLELVGKPRNGSKVYVIRNCARTLPLQPLRVVSLSLEIDCVSGFGLKSLGRLRVDGAKRRPNFGKPRHVDFRIGKQIVARAPRPVPVDEDAMS